MFAFAILQHYGRQACGSTFAVTSKEPTGLWKFVTSVLNSMKYLVVAF